ncbi:MAG: hypothetical protein WBL06_00080 [Pseudolysinimonas sp.]|uniref:hypothetical protein n=1 Tax=Pseudolysinimonas sp. TaxID=2680009 RepID=UPI003C7159C6
MHAHVRRSGSSSPALAARARLLLADEPTGQLDSETAASIMRLLRSLVDATGLAAVVSTHDPRVAAFADRVLEMHDGRIVPAAVGKRPVGSKG